MMTYNDEIISFSSRPFSGLNVTGGFLHRRTRTVLRAGLHDAVIFARRLDHLSPLPDTMAYRLFHIDMLVGQKCLPGQKWKREIRDPVSALYGPT